MDIIPELTTSSLLKLSSFLFWSCLYLLSCARQPEKCPEYHSRVVTLLHGSVSSMVGLAQCGVWSLSICRLTAPILAQHYALMVWSWGYFAFDTLWCIMYWNQGLLMLAHHFCTLGAITLYMHRNGTGCSFSCTMAFMEITNPSLQIRWFLKNEGYGKTPLFYLVDMFYLSSFLLIRGVLGPYILYKIMPVKVFGTDQKILAILLYIISIGLMRELISYISYKYTNRAIVSVAKFLDDYGIILNDCDECDQ
ncbi:TLC domain-containing protein 5-like [Leguminivora glycinivorella]|uniref:TLC domain-containing protein 5-like n=1 Tax=Leguminivora glycinivorella TaxID=1035111 RepID=UPI00200CDBE4|nr:TLC domain-containing protein 5-like [Leguminivora glycinivorella]